MLWTALVSWACVASLLLHWVYVAGRRIILGPETYLILLGTSTYVSTVVAAASEGVPDSPYVLFMGGSLTFFILGTVACRTLLGFRHRSEMAAFLERPWRDDISSGRGLALALALGGIALLTTAAYFYALGYYVPLEALTAYFRAGAEEMQQSYVAARIGTTRGAYLGLGYVMQFKDCILPLVTFLLYFRMRARPGWSRRVLFFLFFAASVMAAVGHGSRAELAYFGAVFLVLNFARFMAPWNLSRLQVLAGVLIVLTVVSAQTLLGANRQAAAMGSTDTGVASLLWAPISIFERVSYGVARERFQLFQLFLEHKDPQLGMGSVEELRHVLPGRLTDALGSYFDLVMYGGGEGDLGFDIWGTLWHEFHFFGILFAFGYGFLLHYFYVRALRGRKSLVRMVTLTYAGFVLGTVGGIYELLIRGFLTLLIYLALAGLAERLTGGVVAMPRQQVEA